MKKILFILLLIGLVFPTASMASWTINITTEPPMKTVSGVEIITIKINATSDGSDPDEFNLNTSTLNSYLNGQEMTRIRGGYLWEVITDPGTAPDSAWSVSFDDGLGGSILDLSSLSTTATELHDASYDLGFYHIVNSNIQVDIGDIGSSSDSVDIYLIIIK